MEIDEKLLDQIADLLSAVYRKVNWRRMKNRNPHDVFQHRVKFAACKSNVLEFLDKLCQGLGIQSIKYDPDKILNLKEKNREVMYALRHESIYLVVKATALAREYKLARKTQEKNEMKNKNQLKLEVKETNGN